MLTRTLNELSANIYSSYTRSDFIKDEHELLTFSIPQPQIPTASLHDSMLNVVIWGNGAMQKR